ncbi:MAG: alpha/beta fold hydrolase [Trueperaceae bacterium]
MPQFRLKPSSLTLVATVAVLMIPWASAQAVEGAPAAPGTLIDVINEGTTGPFEIQRLATPLFGRHGPPIVENGVTSYRIHYWTIGLDGEPAEVAAQLFVPIVERPAARPLYVFGSGTTGVADACAPTRESVYPHPLGQYRPYLLAYAGRGFTAIIPDYLGFNDPDRLQSYFNAEAEARVMLDAVRAVQAFFESTLSGNPSFDDAFFDDRDGSPAGRRNVFLGGYSQGGHAAFAAADLQPAYAPELDLDGILGFGATTDVESLLREGPFYAPYIVLSYRQDYGSELFDPASVLAPRWLGGLELAAGKMCVDVVQAHYPFDGNRVYSRSFAESLYGHTLEQDLPAIARILRQNRTGLKGHGLPSLVVQGEDDVIVWTSSQTRFVRELCARGSDVQYLRFPNVRHRETRPVAFEQSIAWMRGLDRGNPPPSSCGLLE